MTGRFSHVPARESAFIDSIEAYQAWLHKILGWPTVTVVEADAVVVTARQLVQMRDGNKMIIRVRRSFR